MDFFLNPHFYQVLSIKMKFSHIAAQKIAKKDSKKGFKSKWNWVQTQNVIDRQLEHDSKISNSIHSQ